METTTQALPDIFAATAEALRERNFLPTVVATKKEALEKIKALIPAGASVMNGASRTLEEIGYIDHLKAGEHGWNNLHTAIIEEKDPTKQAQLRRQALLSDYYLGSVHALSETGEMVIASNTGSQLPHITFSSPNLILVVGEQKITPTLEAARVRVQDVVLPLEGERMRSVYGPEAKTAINKEFIFHRENPLMGRKVHVVLVREKLGF